LHDALQFTTLKGDLIDAESPFANSGPKPNMKKQRHVALLLRTGWYGTEVEMRGILDYARHQSNWMLSTLPEDFKGDLRSLSHWEGDGAMASVKTKRDAELAPRLSIPGSNAGNGRAHEDLPRRSAAAQRQAGRPQR